MRIGIGDVICPRGKCLPIIYFVDYIPKGLKKMIDYLLIKITLSKFKSGAIDLNQLMHL